MNTERKIFAAASREPEKILTPAQRKALQQAVAKVVALGETVGVSPDEMIQMLHSGLTVGELLQYLSTRAGEVA